MTGAAILAVSVVLTVRATSPGVAPVEGRFPGSRTVIPMASLLAPATLPARVTVVVVHDEAAGGYYASRVRMDTITGAWRRALRAVGAEVRVVRSSALGSAGSADVVVIPAAPCMTVATRELIERRRVRGEGLIVTGVAGTHDAGCRKIGYGLLTQLTGASRVAPVRGRGDAVRHPPARRPARRRHPARGADRARPRAADRAPALGPRRVLLGVHARSATRGR